MAKYYSAKELQKEIEQGVTEFFTSDSFHHYLDVMSRFHNYSFYNLILIMMQNPDATYVAGYKGWQKNFNRHVRKGEKSIGIIAPAPFTITKENEDGEEEKIQIMRFRRVSVFDISQTEGEDLPTICNRLEGTVENYSGYMQKIESISPYPIVREDLKGNCMGYCDHSEEKIVVRNGVDELQVVKTAIHEIAHAKLHGKGCEKSREEKETEAESVAYVVAKRLGLSTDSYSFPYIAVWSKADTKLLRKSMTEVIDVANEISEALLGGNYHGN